MSMANEYQLAITTAADGTATAYTPKVSGWVDRVIVDKGTLADTADVTITDDQDPAMPVVTISNVTADVVAQPRRLVQDAAGADITGAYSYVYVHNARIKVAVAAGGDAKTGTVKILVVSERGQVI